MFNECIEVFEDILERKTEMWLIDNYVPTSGTYVLVNLDNGFSSRKVDIRPDKRTGVVEGQNDKDYRLLSFLDRSSKIITMNKCVEPGKIIHSNNYYSFFVKKESIGLGKLSENNINTYYDILTHPENKYKKAKSKEIYMETEKKLGGPDGQIIAKIREWVLENLEQLIQEMEIDINGKDYLKLFFVYNDEEKTRKEVEKEGTRYLLPNIYNNNDYNEKVDGKIFGLHNNNMVLNDNKPFLKNKSRKISPPCLVDMERVLIQHKFMEYLSSQAAKGKNNIYIDFEDKSIQCLKNGESVRKIDSGFYLRIKQGKTEVEIISADIITGYEPKLRQPFIMKEIFPLSERAREVCGNMYGTKHELKEIESMVNDVFFGKVLMGNYKTPSEDLKDIDKLPKEILLTYRERMWVWFYNSDDTDIKNVVGKLGKKLVSNSMEHVEKAKNQFNLWFSLEDYFEKNRRNEEKMDNVREKFMEHMKLGGEWCFENDEEYYYAVGQVSRYLMDKSKSAKKCLDMLYPIINVKTDEKVKDRVKDIAKKYDYAIDMKYTRAGKTMANIFIYRPSGKVNDVMIMAGYVDTNYLYMSSKNEQISDDEVSENKEEN